MTDFDDEDETITPEEIASARRVGDAVDHLLAKGDLPPAMDVEDRELAEIAAAIADGGAEERGRFRGLVSEVMSAAREDASVISEAPVAGRSNTKWVVASALAAAAAALGLWIATTATGASGERPTVVAQTGAMTFSRSSNALIGPIARSRASDASSRLDVVYAERMTRYRSHAFREQWSQNR